MKKTFLTLTTAATVATLVPTNSADAAAELRTDISTTSTYSAPVQTSTYSASTNTYHAPVAQTSTSNNTFNTYNTNNTTSNISNNAVTESTRVVQKAPTSVAVNNDVASVALSIAAGKSYVYGANSATAVDCSSFAQQVLAAMGKSIPRTTYAQAAAGTQVSAPQPGDLVFFNNYSHVGVYIGGGQMVDALNPSAGIGQRSVSFISGSVDGYYRF
ncbi:C40 family peptidase [Macrococcoides bohemicum]|uniref:C40 family peptidase n=1 Tax=Macrococcoides bohemicum TaxID=1903056 RepID=UPI00165E8494|nr:C40 family peptidase [Macrococcus bohemicus]MBC9874818.1 C40 family peptidase [Macrococcus bohemicus]QRN49180.1 C40 family peptidase [Macrococcus bohemicus]QYA45303.1 C40 family peptidase [Macrococcus bohemicus]